jgi:ABC-type branched-subunit amino acid transport system ATPase component
MPILEASGLYAGYGETEILHGVSMHLESGEFVTIIGPNGAGKSTLVKTLIGLLKPSKGRILYEGREITSRDPADLVVLGLAYVPQSYNTFPSLTVRENIEMGAITRRPGLLARWNLALLKRPRRRKSGTNEEEPDKGGPIRPTSFTKLEFEERLDEIIRIFPNLGPKISAQVNTLSGGEQQMVALAKTLVMDPRVMLIDEPSAGLAPRLVSMIFDKIREINDNGVAIVLVEQNARKALTLADRGYVLEAGRNKYDGPGKVLLNDPDVGRLYLGG